jgi:hypothetical protein
MALYSDVGHDAKWHRVLLKVPSHRRRSLRQHRSSRRHFRHGQCAAVLRAITAAKLYGTGQITSFVRAAECCGTNAGYVQAAVILLKTENQALLGRVLAGHEPLLRAAQRAKRVADLIAAYRSASNADRVAFARTCGPEELLNVLAAAS